MTEPECYICALGPEDESHPPFATIEGPRRTVAVCNEHYSSVVWASVAKGYPKVRHVDQVASR